MFSNKHKNITLNVFYISGPLPVIFPYVVRLLYKTAPANTIHPNNLPHYAANTIKHNNNNNNDNNNKYKPTEPSPTTNQTL